MTDTHRQMNPVNRTTAINPTNHGCSCGCGFGRGCRSVAHSGWPLCNTAILGLICLALTSCATVKPQRSESQRDNNTIANTASASNSESSSSENAASTAIREQAMIAFDNGDIAKANRLLDRALRLAPSDSKNYLALARLRLFAGQAVQARAFATKGLNLRPDAITRKALDDVIQQATEAAKQS